VPLREAFEQVAAQAAELSAKVARNAKPVTRRKYFPNLLIFDSPLFLGLNSGSCLGHWERKVHPAISLKWQSPGIGP
jgi:hypothetical protein